MITFEYYTTLKKEKCPKQIKLQLTNKEAIAMYFHKI